MQRRVEPKTDAVIELVWLFVDFYLGALEMRSLAPERNRYRDSPAPSSQGK
jgi:hypothetical protein